jgi:hypothetical protein
MSIFNEAAAKRIFPRETVATKYAIYIHIIPPEAVPHNVTQTRSICVTLWGNCLTSMIGLPSMLQVAVRVEQNTISRFQMNRLFHQAIGERFCYSSDVITRQR